MTKKRDFHALAQDRLRGRETVKKPPDVRETSEQNGSKMGDNESGKKPKKQK
ncbi:hypothetical protein [Lonsdalea britannica]|uniref:hypothetical protein n=1 Tax=Lonsdalea britannica TaxID=1082704 RepID=UPI0013C35AC4|nr:hypothetical protein [Lonsdalea britannica]